MDLKFEAYLSPTSIMDSDNRAVADYAMDAVKDADKDLLSKAVKLYYAVRDPIWLKQGAHLHN